ncbi:MAG TPA: queuosine salvage family protein [Elusimicrobiota bacterium]|nr:queuosine salvage family protein [Elusimicrobiota bacterium]
MRAAAAASGNPVLPSVLPVLRAAPQVRVRRDKIAEVAARIEDKDLRPSPWRFPVFIDEDSERTIDFFFLGNALNFKYWDSARPESVFAAEYKGATYTGAFAMWACLKRALDAGVPILDADYLARLSDEDVRKLFAGSAPMPMLPQRAAILREVGRVLKAKYHGSFHNLVKDARFRAFDGGGGIVERLARDFPSFDDAAQFRGRKVLFYKRAQLAVGMLYSRLRGTGLFDVPDIDELTVFADYELPKGLRRLGILEYSPDLARKVDARAPIAAGSEDELAIRAATIQAGKLLADELNRRGKKVNALNVDFFLWWSAQQDASAPHHLTETTAY